MEQKIQDPARTVNMVPSLANQSLISGGKFIEAGYVSVCDWEEVNIYNVHTAKITVSEKSVLTGWRCSRTRLWIISLQEKITNPNLHTFLLNGPTGKESLKYLYDVLSSVAVLENIALFHTDPDTPSPEEAIHNVYNLPSIEHTIRYLHATAGFPTKSTRIKSIRNRNYLAWPLITVTNVHKHFS